MKAFNDRYGLPAADRLKLKAGIHTGPSIMVTLNERLDYFGQTVNLASRIQELSLADTITLSQDVFDDPGIVEILTGYPVEALKAQVKGIEKPVIVNRFKVIE